MNTAMPHRLLLLITLCTIAFAAGGCNILGPATYLVTGPGTVDAEFELEDRPTVVFVDDRENRVNPVSLRRSIADKVSEELMSRELVTTTIRPADAMGVAARHDTREDVMPIDAIGREVGAEQVIYIEMVAFTDRVNAETLRGLASCNVRVIDVVNRKRLFPSGDDEQPYRHVQAMTREISEELYRTRATRVAINETVAEELGSAITKLFYRHEPRELGGRLGNQ